MELDDRPTTAKFTATVDTRIVSDNGAKCMNFEAGETLAVHRDLFTAAIAAGLVPEEPLVEAPPPQPPQQTQEEMVSEGLVEACKTLIARGDSKDFTMVGLPRAASVKKLVDFDFKSIDVQKAFEQAIHEVEHGDDSQEHSEPDSGSSE